MDTRLDWNVMVTFNDGSKKHFIGFWKECMQEIANYCDEHDLIAEKCEPYEKEEETIVENSETVYKTFLCGERVALPEPTITKSVITIHATVHEEQGEWIDWWIDCDEPGIFLPDDEKECEKYLRKFDIILVGDKWFPGKDAKKAMQECCRQYRKITILDDKDHLVAEIYDRQTIYDCDEDLGRYRWQSQKFGNIERSFADVLQCAEDGDVFKHNYKGW